jgi:predicted nucleic acid-binding protein
VNVYLDTSVVLRRLLGQPQALASWGGWERVYASALLPVEAARSLDRLRLDGALDDPRRATLSRQLQTICEAVYLVPITEAVLERAGAPFPTIIGTLDAIHLTTAMIVRQQEQVELKFLTHDQRLALAAQSMHFAVDGV